MYRTLVAYAVSVTGPSGNTPTPLFEIGAFVYQTVSRDRTEELKRAVDDAFSELYATKRWGFRPKAERHMEKLVRVDSDEKPRGLEADEIGVYMYWYDRNGNIIGGGGTPEEARRKTKYASWKGGL